MPGIDAYTKLMLHCNGSNGSTIITDDSRNNNHGTRVGTAQISTAQSKFGGASLLLDGNSDYVTVPDSADWDYGTGDFTIDLWFYANSFADYNHFYVQDQDGAGSNYNVFRINPDKKIRVDFTYAGTPRARGTSTNAITINTGEWHHFALVRDGATCRVFYDGVPVPMTMSTDFGSADVGTQNANLQIGCFISTYYANGYFDEFRVSKGIARWKTDFSASLPSSEYTDDRSTIFIESTQDDAGFQIGTTSGVERFANQYFTLATSKSIVGGTFKLSASNGSPTGTITCSIQTVNGSNIPTGTLANANATVNITPVASNTNYFTFPSAFTLSAGTYAVCFRSTSGQGAETYWIDRRSTSDVLANSAFVYYEGGSYAVVSTSDLVFSLSGNSTTAIKSIGGVAYAGIKKVGGIAIASVKKIGGLA